VTPTGGEDSISNLHISKPVGSLRTYANFAGASFTVASWFDALRKGRTFFTGGPLLDLEVGGKAPGDAVNLQAAGTVRLRARVWSIVPLSRVVIYRNGEPWREVPVDASFWSAQPANRPCVELETDVAVDRSSWFTLYAEGPHSDVLDVRFPQAETNAVRVYVGDQKIRNRESAEYFIRWINKLTRMADQWPGWRSDRERKHVFSQFTEARAVYERLVQEARP
jgi:hypothetical protein